MAAFNSLWKPLLPLLCAFGVVTTTATAWGNPNDLERLVRKDGTSVVGVIIGFGQGSYRVRVGDGTVEVPAHEVRTIEAAGEQRPGESIQPRTPQSWVEEIAEDLAVRPAVGVSNRSRRLYSDSLAGLLRGEWDFTLRGALSVLESEPGWADPAILALVVQTETGRESDALRLALRITAEHPRDLLATQVAAEVFRRGGFPLRAAELEEKVLLVEGGPGARRHLTKVWWPLDRTRAADHWDQILNDDPRLDRADFPEAVLLRKAKAAIALGDLVVAGQTIEEAARDFPWTEVQVNELRISLTEARLRQAELGGDLALATLAAETLDALGATRPADLDSRLSRLREKGISRALQENSAEELQKWFHEHAHLIEGSSGSDATVAARMQELGLDALTRGDLRDAQAGLALARQIDPAAESPRASTQVVSVVNRAIDELSRRHEERAMSTLKLLHQYLPQRDAVAVHRLKKFLERPQHDFLTDAERRNIASRLATMYGSSGVALGSIPAPPETRRPERAIARVTPISDDAVAEIGRWFPIAIGTRWTYRLDDGSIEEREIIQSRADGEGGWMVVIRVAPQGRLEYETRAWIREGELILGSPTVPPGEVFIRGALAINDSWEWRRGNFRYSRSVEEARYPVETPIGVFHDVRVIRAENSLHSAEGGRTWNAIHRITLAEGIGVVRIDGASETVDRELIEFRPGDGGDVLKAAHDGQAKPTEATAKQG